MQYKLPIFGLFLMFFCLSCEEEIQLPNEDPRTVVDGRISNEGVEIKISKTISKTDPRIIPLISDAQVQLIDQSGVSTVLPFQSNGTYQTSFNGNLSEKYQLIIDHNGESYEAEVTMPESLLIFDSVKYTRVTNSTGLPIYAQYNVFMTLPDSSRPIFGQIKMGTEFFDTRQSVVFNFNDRNRNGNQLNVLIDRTILLENGTDVSLEVLNFDAGYFKYLEEAEALNFSTSQGGFNIAPPANLEGNISNNALGYFGAYTRYFTQITIE